MHMFQEELHDSHFEYLLQSIGQIHWTVEPHILSIVHEMITTELCQYYTYLHV